MTTSPSLAALVARVEALTGPDHAVDQDVARVLGIAPTTWTPGWPWPMYTASVDAVLSLVERKLPGWAKGFDSGPKTHIAFVDPSDYADRFLSGRHTTKAPTPALALLLALLLALTQETR